MPVFYVNKYFTCIETLTEKFLLILFIQGWNHSDQVSCLMSL